MRSLFWLFVTCIIATFGYFAALRMQNPRGRVMRWLLVFGYCFYVQLQSRQDIGVKYGVVK